MFLSYRRTNVPWSLAIFQNLTQHGFDVFFDLDGIASGDFERVILGNNNRGIARGAKGDLEGGDDDERARGPAG